MKKFILIPVFMFIIIQFAVNVHADFYGYTNEEGNVVFTDNPGNIPENQRSKVKTIEEQQNAPSKSNEKNINNQYLTEKETQRDLKKEYVGKEPCPHETKDQARQAIKETWAGMAQAMASGNLERAIGFFTPGAREDMKRTVSTMSKENIREIFSDYESIEVSTLYEDDGIANGGVIRKEKSGIYSYPVSFRKDFDCKWRVMGL
ncbi:MAG: DUF4124 domain-containing protein [Smithella sp.]